MGGLNNLKVNLFAGRHFSSAISWPCHKHRLHPYTTPATDKDSWLLQ